MLYLRVKKVLKCLLLLGILLTVTWLICYSAYEDGFHPSESPDSNYDGEISTIHLQGTEGLHAHEENATSPNKGADNVVRAMNKPSALSDSAGALNTGGGTGRGNGTLPPSLSTTTHTIRTEDEKQTRMTGYVVGVSFWDQQTWSVGNILSMQCWAGHHGMVVAEPFMIDTKFGAPLTAEAMKHNDTMVRLGRLYDLDHWNEYSKKRGYAPMVEWNDFLHQAPRDVIIINLKPTQSGCYSDIHILPYGFKVVKKLCFVFKLHHTPLSMNNFTAHVFGNFSSSDVTVIFSEWSTTTIIGHVNLNTVKCQPTLTFDPILPSKMMYDDANKYIHQYLSENNFMAVMLRIEWLLMSIQPQNIGKVASSCLEQTMKRLQLIQNQTQLNSTFVAIDVGRFGSKTYPYLNSDAVLEPVQAFFRTVYGNSSSLQQWESTFEKISSSPGYIGFLQKVIATRAKCILLTGSGTSTFHKHALSMYKELHKGTNDNTCYAVANMQCRVDTSKGVTLD